jgi:hypothetical protein
MKKIYSYSRIATALFFFLASNQTAFCVTITVTENAVKTMKTKLHNSKFTTVYKQQYTNTVRPNIESALTAMEKFKGLQSCNQNISDLKKYTTDFDNINTTLKNVQNVLTQEQTERLNRVQRYKTQLENIAKNITNLYKITMITHTCYQDPYKVPSTTDSSKWGRKGIPLIEATGRALKDFKNTYDDLENSIFNPLIAEAIKIDKKLTENVNKGIKQGKDFLDKGKGFLDTIDEYNPF